MRGWEFVAVLSSESFIFLRKAESKASDRDEGRGRCIEESGKKHKSDSKQNVDITRSVV